jgi:hypothetical protein
MSKRWTAGHGVAAVLQENEIQMSTFMCCRYLHVDQANCIERLIAEIVLRNKNLNVSV